MKSSSNSPPIEERPAKRLFRALDGAAIEAVLMGYPRRATLCISSQAGCALGCTFCATGQFGFERNLVAGEIVAQVAYAQAFLRQIGMPDVPDHLTNIVFMGMGEPLANSVRVAELDPCRSLVSGARTFRERGPYRLLLETIPRTT